MRFKYSLQEIILEEMLKVFFEEVGFSVCIYDCFIMNVFYINLYVYNKVFK